MTPERAFLVLAIAGGVAIGAALPPAAAPDEAPHTARVFTLAEGVWLPPGPDDPPATIPMSIPELHRAMNGDGFPTRVTPRTPAEMRALLATPLAPRLRTRLAHGGPYPPVAYFPALVGVSMARSARLSAGWMIYAGRAGTLVAWVALVWLAIRTTPVRRWTLAFLALAPMSLATGATVSADAFTNAAALLFVAVVMRSAFGRTGPIDGEELAALLAAALLLGGSKGGYWALAGVAFVIPAARCGGATPRARRLRWLGLVAAIALAVLLPGALWLLAVSAAETPPGSPGADPGAQLRLVLGDPLGFARVLADTVAAQGIAWLRSFVGVLGPLTVPLPPLAYAAFSAGLALALVADGPPPAGLDAVRRLWLLAVFAACVGTTLLLAYVGWNQPGAPQVLGVQGRYFIPAAPLLALAIPSWRHALPRRAPLALVGLTALVLALSVHAIVARYYVL